MQILYWISQYLQTIGICLGLTVLRLLVNLPYFLLELQKIIFILYSVNANKILGCLEIFNIIYRNIWAVQNLAAWLHNIGILLILNYLSAIYFFISNLFLIHTFLLLLKLSTLFTLSLWLVKVKILLYFFSLFILLFTFW